jgi:RNA polymerase sigma factor (sigma-70 family)
MEGWRHGQAGAASRSERAGLAMSATAAPWVRMPGPGCLLAAIAGARLDGEPITTEAEVMVVRLFHQEGRSLVRLARLFVDDRDAAEDIVQEAFLRLARHAGRIDTTDRAPAYLRSIVLNLARDHNRRGLVSLRHQAAAGREIDVGDDVGDVLARSEEHRHVLELVRQLPLRQRDCITLRYFEEMSIDDIAATLGVSPNSVKTHLRRGMENLGKRLDLPAGVT